MVIEVKVIVNSSKVLVEKLAEMEYKVKLTEAACKGKANKQLIKVLADYFNVRKRQIKILKGFTNSLKTVEID